MPEIKNTFLKGRMNQDLDSRILPIGEYRDEDSKLVNPFDFNTMASEVDEELNN